MKFFDFFPTPRYLQLAEAGVSISDKAVRFVTFDSMRDGSFELKKYGEEPLLEGVVSGGEINDKEALIETLKKLREEHHFTFVSATLPEEKTYLFITELERLPYRDLRDSVAFVIEENAPVSLKESIFSFELLDNKESLQAAVTVLPTAVAVNYIEAYEAAGLTPVSLDIESQAIARAVVKHGDNRSHLIIHVGERKSALYLVEDEVVQFSSILNTDFDKMGQEESIKSIKAEMRKFFVFWNTRLDKNGRPGRKIEHCIVGGSGAANDALVAALMSDIEIPYALANVWSNVLRFDKHLPKIPFDASLSYAGTIGTAIGESLKEYV